MIIPAATIMVLIPAMVPPEMMPAVSLHWLCLHVLPYPQLVPSVFGM